jgi:hypothetical protein
MPSTSGRVVQFQVSLVFVLLRLPRTTNQQREDKVKILKEMKDSLPDVKQGLFDTSNMYPVTAKIA